MSRVACDGTVSRAHGWLGLSVCLVGVAAGCKFFLVLKKILLFANDSSDTSSSLHVTSCRSWKRSLLSACTAGKVLGSMGAGVLARGAFAQSVLASDGCAVEKPSGGAEAKRGWLQLVWKRQNPGFL